MKEIEVEINVPDCTAQSYFDVIYAGDAALRAFHAKVNGDANAAAEAWGSDGTRSVRFTMPMNVPAMLKKVIGMDSVPVVETQRVEWGAGCCSFKLISEPLLNFPGANKFTTSGFLAVASRPDGSCSVKALMQCAAAMPWPMNTTVEGLMATEAAASINTFLTWCRDYYASWKVEQGAVPERPAPARAAAAPRPPRTTTEGEQFFDALEDEEEAVGYGGEAEAEEALVPYQPPRLEDVIVDCLRQIQASTAQTASSLQALEELIRNMDDNMQVVREKLVGRRPQPTSGRAPSASPSAAAAARGAAVASRSGGASGGYVAAFAAGALVAGAAAAAYFRYKGLGSGSGSG
ncbi:hypothetical protein GPECTOR_6g788 [Gonium pectorale]|uniref:VASt domain-containing protein n=1 Tax=Gonium pectorale TaxID=33097 RepID=A0A150GWX3_GONPE|nr:hypothetical protein GPECTOR_6g788 [Gonium pectorale]|eukprot:KXZ53870.1 hypothetical protein GPECTOR_6g788 [Gonium pectorale]